MVCKNCTEQMMKLGVFEILLGSKAEQSSFASFFMAPVSTPVLKPLEEGENRNNSQVAKASKSSVEFVPTTPIRMKMDIYESLSRDSGTFDSDDCRPSKLKEFQREKLETICKNKIRTQFRNQAAMDGLGEDVLMEGIFSKNERTGEYEADSCSMEKLKTEANQRCRENMTVRLMVEKFEHKGSSISSERCKEPRDCQASLNFKDILSRFARSDNGCGQ